MATLTWGIVDLDILGRSESGCQLLSLSGQQYKQEVGKYGCGVRRPLKNLNQLIYPDMWPLLTSNDIEYDVSKLT